jgi:hypothetical protein
MCTRRDVMATMSLEGLAAMACGLPGREIARGGSARLVALCTWRVLSQEAETTSAFVFVVG